MRLLKKENKSALLGHKDLNDDDIQKIVDELKKNERLTTRLEF
jgi:hypothetical protein